MILTHVRIGPNAYNNIEQLKKYSAFFNSLDTLSQDDLKSIHY